MATIYELLQNMNPEVKNTTQPKMSLQDLIFQEEEKKRQAQALQNQNMQMPVANIEQNIPTQPQITSKNIPNLPQISPVDNDNNINPKSKLLSALTGLNFDDIRPNIKYTQDEYKAPPKPYSIQDFGKYYKQGKGFWGKVGGGIADVLASLGTPEGMKIAGALSYGLGGNIYQAKAMTDQGDVIAQQQAQQKKQYDDYMKDLRSTSKDYDLKMMDLLGKEAFSALKGGKGVIYIDKMNGKAYLPETQEDGTVKNIEVNPSEYIQAGYITKDLFKPEMDETEKLATYKNKLDLATQSFAQRKALGENIEIGYTGKKEAAKLQPGTPQYANLATKLSDDYRGDIKDYAILRQNYKTMETVLDDSLKNPKMSMMTVDQALITTFNKMLDPGSVVRESEYARTPEGQAKLQQVQGFLDKLKQGGAGLTPKERISMVNTASKLMNAGNDYYNEKRKSYSDMANEYGVKPSLVVGKDLVYKPKSFNYSEKTNMKTFSSPESADKSGLKKGTIVLINGRRYQI